MIDYREMLKDDYKIVTEMKTGQTVFSDEELSQIADENIKDFIIHLKEYGEISEFQYKLGGSDES